MSWMSLGGISMGKNEKKTSAPESTIEKCTAHGCKASAHRFSFCDEHYDHFKFGLIKKSGEPVSDYDKKYGHYMAWKEAGGVRKAA